MLALGEAGLAPHPHDRPVAHEGEARDRRDELLLERHGGEVPSERAALESLPGVGRKTANVVLNTAFGEPTIAVDTHIFRVSNRTGLAPGRHRAGGRGPADEGRARGISRRTRITG